MGGQPESGNNGWFTGCGVGWGPGLEVPPGNNADGEWISSTSTSRPVTVRSWPDQDKDQDRGPIWRSVVQGKNVVGSLESNGDEKWAEDRESPRNRQRQAQERKD